MGGTIAEDQGSSSKQQLSIKRIVLVIVMIALAIFLLIETLGTTAEVESSLGPILTSM